MVRIGVLTETRGSGLEFWGSGIVGIRILREHIGQDWSLERSRMVKIGILVAQDSSSKQSRMVRTGVLRVWGVYGVRTGVLRDQGYARRFLTLGAPKSSQNIGIYDVFATPKKARVAKTPLFATLWQDHMSEMLYFTGFLNHLLKNTGIHSVFRKHMHKTP